MLLNIDINTVGIEKGEEIRWLIVINSILLIISTDEVKTSSRLGGKVGIALAPCGKGWRSQTEVGSSQILINCLIPG